MLACGTVPLACRTARRRGKAHALPPGDDDRRIPGNQDRKVTLRSTVGLLSHASPRHELPDCLQPRVLDGLDGSELSEALRAYVRRAQRGAGDSELVIGTGKCLEEAL
jgi:hypothetical protein